MLVSYAFAVVAALVCVTTTVACATDVVAAVPDDVNGVSAAFLSCCKWVFANAVVVVLVLSFALAVVPHFLRQSTYEFSTVLINAWLNLYGTIVIAAARS